MKKCFSRLKHYLFFIKLILYFILPPGGIPVPDFNYKYDETML